VLENVSIKENVPIALNISPAANIPWVLGRAVRNLVTLNSTQRLRRTSCFEDCQ